MLAAGRGTFGGSQKVRSPFGDYCKIQARENGSPESTVVIRMERHGQSLEIFGLHMTMG